MSKRKNTDPTEGNKRARFSKEFVVLRDEKFKLLQDKLRELGVTIKLSFITSITNNTTNQLQFIEFLLQQDPVSGQFQYIKLKILEDNDIKLTNISSILTKSGIKGSEAFNSLFEKLCIQQGNIWVKSGLLYALMTTGISFTNITSMLNGSGIRAPEAFESFVKKLFVRQGNIWVKSELLQALENSKISLSTISSILSRSGTKAPEAFELFIKKLFTQQEDHRWVKSELFQALERAEIPFPNISSILSGSGIKASESFDSFIKKLFVQQGNIWVKSELLQALENSEISFTNVSSILSGARAKAPESFDLFIKKLFIQQGNIWVKSELLQALENAKIPLSNISSILNRSGAKAPESFDLFIKKLFVQQGNIWVKSELLQALENANLSLSNISSFLIGARAKAPEAFESFVKKLFTQQGNIWVKSELLQTLENAKISLSSIASILSGSGTKAAEVFEIFIKKLFTQQGNIWVKSESLQALENAQISFTNIASILHGSGAKAAEVFKIFVKKLLIQQGNIWVKSELLQALENAKVSFTNIASILHGSGAKAPEVFELFVKKLLIQQNNIWVKSELLQALENAKISTSTISNLLSGSGAKAAESFELLVNKLFIQQNNIWVKSELLQALENAKIYLPSISSMLNGSGVKAAESFELLVKKLLIQQNNIWVKSELLQALEITGAPLSSISGILHGSGAKAAEIFESFVKKLLIQQNNIWVKSELLEALEITGVSLSNISNILHGSGAKAAEIFESFVKKLLIQQGTGWVKSELFRTLENVNISFANIAGILGSAGAKGPKIFDSLVEKLLIKSGNVWIKSELLQALENANISFANISSILKGSGAKSPEAFDSLVEKLLIKSDNIWVKSELLKALENADISFANISDILKGSGAKAPEAFDSLFEKLFSLNPEFTALNNSANKYIPSEMLTAFNKIGVAKIFGILHDAGINADQACQKLLELLFIKQNNEYVLIPNLDPSYIDRQVIIQLINHKKSAAANAPINAPINAPALFGGAQNYDDNIFHNFLVGAGSQQLPVLLPEDIDNIINDFNDPDNLDINIQELEILPAEEVVDYFDNLEDPSEDQSMGEYNLAGQCSSGVGRYKRFVGNVCIIDSSNHEKFENEESYTKLAKVWQSNHDPLTHDILPPDTLPPDTQNRLGTIALDSLNNLGRGMQEAFNMFMFVKDISKKDPEGLAKDIGILYGIPKATEFIEQKLMQLTEQYPSFNNLLKGGRVGGALNLGLNINDLQNSIKSLEDAPDQYTKSIAEIRITADGGLIAFSVIDLLSLFLEGAAVTSGVGAIAAICVTIASTLATSNIEARKICDELECVGQEYRDIFGTLLLDKPLADNIKNDLQAKEIYGKWLDIMGQMLVNMTGFDAYVTTLPTISIERVQTYTGTLKVMSTPRLSYCDISTSQEATLIEHIPSSAHILSLSNSLKYSGHSRILKLPSDNIKLACNPTASDVQVIDNIRPAANDPGYLQYSKQASVCGSCEQVPTSDIERLIRLNNSNFTISFTVQTKTTKYIIENHSNKHYISIRQSEGTDKKSLYLSLNAGDDIYFIDDYNHITINSTTSTNNQTLSDLIVFQLPTNELLNIRCLGQGDNVIIEYRNIVHLNYEYYKPSLIPPYDNRLILDFREVKVKDIMFRGVGANMHIIGGNKIEILPNWDIDSAHRVMLLVREGIVNGKLLDLTNCLIAKLIIQPHLSMNSTLDVALCDGVTATNRAFHFQFCKDQCISKANLPQLGKIVLKSNDHDVRTLQVINGNITYELKIENNGFNWRQIAEGKTLLILLPENKKVQVLEANDLNSYTALSIPQIDKALNLEFNQQSGNLILKLKKLNKLIIIKDFYNHTLSQQLVTINLREEKINAIELHNKFTQAPKINSPYVIYDLNPITSHLKIKLSINQPNDTGKIAILDLNKVKLSGNIAFSKREQDLIIICKSANEQGEILTNNIEIVNWNIQLTNRGLLFHNNKIFNLTKCTSEQLNNLNLSLSYINPSYDECRIANYRSKREADLKIQQHYLSQPQLANSASKPSLWGESGLLAIGAIFNTIKNIAKHCLSSRLLSKLAFGKEFEGDEAPKTTGYLNISGNLDADLSTALEVLEQRNSRPVNDSAQGHEGENILAQKNPYYAKLTQCHTSIFKDCQNKPVGVSSGDQTFIVPQTQCTGYNGKFTVLPKLHKMPLFYEGEAFPYPQGSCHVIQHHNNPKIFCEGKYSYLLYTPDNPTYFNAQIRFKKLDRGFKIFDSILPLTAYLLHHTAIVPAIKEHSFLGGILNCLAEYGQMFIGLKPEDNQFTLKQLQHYLDLAKKSLTTLEKLHHIPNELKKYPAEKQNQDLPPQESFIFQDLPEPSLSQLPAKVELPKKLNESPDQPFISELKRQTNEQIKQAIFNHWQYTIEDSKKELQSLIDNIQINAKITIQQKEQIQTLYHLINGIILDKLAYIKEEKLTLPDASLTQQLQEMQLAHKYGLQIQNVLADGNEFFQVVALYSKKLSPSKLASKAWQLRNKACDYIYLNQTQFTESLNQDATIKEYLLQMRKNTTPVDDLMIKALSEKLQQEIIIINLEEDEIISFSPSITTNTPPIIIARINQSFTDPGGHYGHYGAIKISDETIFREFYTAYLQHLQPQTPDHNASNNNATDKNYDQDYNQESLFVRSFSHLDHSSPTAPYQSAAVFCAAEPSYLSLIELV